MRGTPQLDYDFNLDKFLDGMVQDGRTKVIEDHVALGLILFGRGLTSGSNSGSTPGLTENDGVQTPKRNVAALIASGDLEISNVVNGKVNGVAIDPVTFASNNLTTVTALMAEIIATLAAQGITATGALSNSNNTITITAENASVTFTEFVVTLGSGQATYTSTYTTSYVFRGVAAWIQKQLVSDGVAGYAETEQVSVCRRGLVAVRAKGAVNKDAAVYCVLATDGEEGVFTETSTGNIAVSGAVARTAAADGELFLLELNLPA